MNSKVEPVPAGAGACYEMPVSWWFPHFDPRRNGSIAAMRQNREKAIEICNSCEYKEQCLEWSLHHEPLGVWGGMPEYPRAVLRAKRGIECSNNAFISVPGKGVRNVSAVKG